MENERELYAGCPLCSSSRTNVFLHADWSGHPMFAQAGGTLSPTMRWTSCEDCAHIFTEGFFRPEVFARLMQGVISGQVVGANFEAQRMVSSRMLEKVLPFADAGLWLDVGFGNGSLLMTAQEYGFDVVGCDLRQIAVDAVKAIGIEAHCKDMTGLELPRKCSVLSMADVLEHMPYPKVGLQAAHGLLEGGGILFVSLPNIESPAWMLLDQAGANPYWGEVEHYHNFSRSRLYALLEETGFKPLRYGVSERYRVCMEVVARKI